MVPVPGWLHGSFYECLLIRSSALWGPFLSFVTTPGFAMQCHSPNCPFDKLPIGKRDRGVHRLEREPTVLDILHNRDLHKVISVPHTAVV